MDTPKASLNGWILLPPEVLDEDYHHPILSDITKLQIFLATFTAIIITVLLRPLGIPPMISQIIAGIVLGPSILGHIPGFRQIFPCVSFRSFLMAYGGIGIIFIAFLDGLQIDIDTILKPGRKAIVIGISVLVFPIVVTSASGLAISHFAGLNHIAHREIVFVGIAECISSFSIVTYYLHELKIINTEFSRIASASTMVSNLLTISFVAATLVSSSLKHGSQMDIAMEFGHYVPMLLLIVLLFRPVILWMDKQMLEGQAMKETHINGVILSVVILSSVCLVCDINMMYGPFCLGLLIPSGSRVGSALVKRLEPFNTWLVMPIFYTICGNEVDMSRVMSVKALRIGLLVLFSHAGKFLGAFIPALLYNMTYTDATLLGLSMNAQGFLELLLFTEFNNHALILKDTYAIMIVSIVVLTGASMPIMRSLYKSSVKYEGCNRKTIQHAQPHDEFRVLVCLHNEDEVPPVILLLRASNPAKGSPIKVSVVHFVELVSRSIPLFISHRVHKNHPGAPASSHRIMNVFISYEESNIGGMYVEPYTIVTPYGTMDSDVCKLALQKGTNFIVLPFHERIDSGISNTAIRMMNRRIFENAPCSVGILIDRGRAGDFVFATEKDSTSKVAVIFLGGADDREALAYAARMSLNPNVDLSVLRFLQSDNECAYTMEGLLDDEILREFKLNVANNRRVTYIEKKVHDGIELIEVVETMRDTFDLIMLGRQHDRNLPLIIDLTEWNCSELGTMADIFIELKYGGNATILVVQQQRRAAQKIAWQHEDMQLKSRNRTRVKKEIPL